jgi:hypothetical protein
MPAQVPMDGVTLMVATTGLAEVLVAVKLAIFPFPLAANPMEALLLVHAKVALAGLLVKLKGPAVSPWQ